MREQKITYLNITQDMKLIDFLDMEKGVYLIKMKQGKNFI